MKQFLIIKKNSNPLCDAYILVSGKNPNLLSYSHG